MASESKPAIAWEPACNHGNVIPSKGTGLYRR